MNKRKTRRKDTSEEKIRIDLNGLRGEESIAELCRDDREPQQLSSSISQQWCPPSEPSTACTFPRERPESRTRA